MGICNQIVDRKPTESIMQNIKELHDKYQIVGIQTERLFERDAYLRMDLEDIKRSWMDIELVQELDWTIQDLLKTRKVFVASILAS